MKKNIILIWILSIILASCSLNSEVSTSETKVSTPTVNTSWEIKEIVLDKVPTKETLSESEVKELQWKAISDEEIIKETDLTIEKLREEMNNKNITDKKLNEKEIQIK